MKRALAVGLVVALATSIGATSASAVERTSARVLLSSLPVANERLSGYDRAKFAGWTDADGNGCDTREDVFIAERISGRVAGCTVDGGRWRSTYDGVVTTNPGVFDIDHRVPLEEAWASGAWRWTGSTRARYANDLGYAAALLAVTAHSNRSKGAQEPGEWMPDAASQRCSYVRNWIGVKYRWRLSVDAAEKSYLSRELRTCDPRMTVPQLAGVDFR